MRCQEVAGVLAKRLRPMAEALALRFLRAVEGRGKVAVGLYGFGGASLEPEGMSEVDVVLPLGMARAVDEFLVVLLRTFVFPLMQRAPTDAALADAEVLAHEFQLEETLRGFVPAAQLNQAAGYLLDEVGVLALIALVCLDQQRQGTFPFLHRLVAAGHSQPRSGILLDEVLLLETTDGAAPLTQLHEGHSLQL